MAEPDPRDTVTRIYHRVHDLLDDGEMLPAIVVFTLQQLDLALRKRKD